jgi:hypothetical protein
MGRKSRSKAERNPAPLDSLPVKGYLLSPSTLMFVAGVFIAAYGSSAMQYSRWDHAYNATVHPVFHPWAVIVGVLMIIFALRNRAAR